ncbi:MAG: hypothetical protein JWN29_1292 [Acidimicrobiales bacterium]|nr:hypothetical protein [Acidimicrobiales bacterium]
MDTSQVRNWIGVGIGIVAIVLAALVGTGVISSASAGNERGPGGGGRPPGLNGNPFPGGGGAPPGFTPPN